MSASITGWPLFYLAVAVNQLAVAFSLVVFTSDQTKHWLCYKLSHAGKFVFIFGMNNVKKKKKAIYIYNLKFSDLHLLIFLKVSVKKSRSSELFELMLLTPIKK